MIRVIVDTNPRFSITRHAIGFALQTVPIGVGVWWDSEPLQWLGFFCSILFLLAVSVWYGRKDYALTIEAARKRLDEIERADRPARR